MNICFWVTIKWDCNYKMGFKIKEYLAKISEHWFCWVPGPVLQAGDRDELDTLLALQESRGHTPWWSSSALGLAGSGIPFVGPSAIISHDSNLLMNKLGRCINLCWESSQSHRPECRCKHDQHSFSLCGDMGKQTMIRMLLAKPGIKVGAGNNLKVSWERTKVGR